MSKKLKELFVSYKKSINPPYKNSDFLVLGGTFLVLLVAFVAVISLPNQQNNYKGNSAAAGACQFQSATGLVAAFCDDWTCPV